MLMSCSRSSTVAFLLWREATYERKWSFSTSRDLNYSLMWESATEEVLFITILLRVTVVLNVFMAEWFY
jgi:hypothetical protein